MVVGLATDGGVGVAGAGVLTVGLGAVIARHIGSYDVRQEPGVGIR